MKNKIIHYFNQGASTYDLSADVQAFVAKQLAARIQISSVKNILEIGCGTGLYSQHLISLFPESNLLLTDIAPGMEEACRKRFHSFPLIKTQCIDAESDFTDKKYDLITSSMTLHWFENLTLSLQKLINALSPGGTLIFAMLGKGSLREWRDMCLNSGISVGSHVFPEKSEINIPNLKIDIEIFQQRYANAYTFLHSLKSLGARASHGNHIPVSAGKLRQLCRRYSQEVTISYEIIYGSYTK